jgi:glycosyltransferase involved in cell wall biosynthesis
MADNYMIMGQRILFIGEFSELSTGYSTYHKELISRLHDTDKYEIAELACYVAENDERLAAVPWKCFGNGPAKRTPEFDADQVAQFGQRRFDQTCLDFRPDVVVDVRDEYMLSFEQYSPFRRFFHHVIMPPVDSIPQHEKWLSTYVGSDRVLNYTDWSREVLEKEGGGLIKIAGVAPPGADLETFRPMDRAKLLRKFGFEPDVNIVGMAARNQQRKLYPNLIDAFRDFLKAADPAIAEKTYLYLHTSYPDVGWDIPHLIKNSGISHKILVTYKCRECNNVTPAFYQDARGACHACGGHECGLPNVKFGVDRLTLACIMNLFDVYIQYATNEGFGMPMVEAASCGIPVMATDYSAMSDVVRKLDGYPIRVANYQMEPGVGIYRAIPDNADLVRLLIDFFNLSPEERKRKGEAARHGVESHYTWDKTAAVWQDVFDSLLIRPIAETWESPTRIHQPLSPPKVFPSNETLVKWCIKHVLGRPEMTDSYLALRLIRDLNWGVTAQNVGEYTSDDSGFDLSTRLRPFGADDMVAELRHMCEVNNQWEARRCLTQEWKD